MRFLSLCQSIAQEIPHHFLHDRWIQTALVDMWESYAQIVN